MDLKARARERLDQARGSLEELSHRIHADPELGYQEVKASAWLAEALDEAGFQVEAGICDLPTAFRATCGSGPLHVVFCAEYDALPRIGHACGHNIIAAMSAGAGLAAASVVGEVGLKVTVMGTPAEEVIRQGGKVLLIERGAFQGVHAAMMAHPAPADVAELPIIAATGFEVRYYGKAAHASAFPEPGVNAADAMTIAQTAIGINSLPAVNHQPEFAAHCVTQDADRALYDGALALAWTAIDMATNPAIRARLLARHVSPEK